MTSAHRKKLRNWFCSMALLALVCTLALADAWIWTSQNLTMVADDITLDMYAGPMSTGFLPYLAYFPPLVFWHFCDFMENDEQEDRWRGWLSTYRGFIIFLLLASPIAIFGAGNGFDLTGTNGMLCANGDADFRNVLHSCNPSASETFLMVVVAPVAALACVSKAITALLSHRGASA